MIQDMQKNFEIRAAMDENAVVVKPNAFEGCANLVNVNIKATVTEVGDHAFADCKNLVKLDIADSVQTIGAFAYFNCSGLSTLTIG